MSRPLACRKLLRNGSKSFFAASLLLPRAVREPACSLYAFCRIADDLVDDSAADEATIDALRRRARFDRSQADLSMLLEGQAQVLTVQGEDVTAAFVQGARLALALVQRHGIGIAVLKSGSPSCGNLLTYDGTFSGTTWAELEGMLVTADETNDSMMMRPTLTPARRAATGLPPTAPC